jgi:hemolysin activation/secretion protein
MHRSCRPVIKRVVLAAIACLLLPAAAFAAPVTPGAGNLLQQTQPQRSPRPSRTRTGLRIASPKQGVSASKIKFAVRHIEITGNTLFATSALHGLVASGEGKSLTLGELERLAGKITDYYHAHGYALSRAVIPAQTVKDGVIHFEVIEARFGKINLNNPSPVHDRLLHETLAPLQSGSIIGDASLNRALLLLSDIPGVSPEASLSPGSQVGTSDLNVEAKAAPRVTGDITADNYGNAYTGRGRVGAAVAINDPFHLGDALDVNFMTAGKGLEYGSAAYDVVVNGSGTSVGASYSALHYILGGSLSSLRGYGTANVASAWVRQPVIRSLTLNLYVQAQLDHKRLRVHIDASNLRTDRHLNDGVFSVSGDVRDDLLGTDAVNTWSVSWTPGQLSFDDPAAASSDAATAATAGQFSKWNAAAVRLQQIDVRNSLYLSASGQWADKNLDSVEKMVVGGPYGLRGYDMGVLSADTGYLATVELRHSFSQRLQGRVFGDAEHVSVNAKPWATGRNTYSLGDVGIGLDVAAPHRWHLTAYLARPVGVVPSGLGNRTTTRGWLQLSKMF